jgi:hypothetical protein
VLLFDEITAGFRMNTGGAHLVYGIEPDMATYAKALSNGFAMAAIVGAHAGHGGGAEDVHLQRVLHRAGRSAPRRSPRPPSTVVSTPARR